MSSRFPRFGIVCMGAGFTLLGIFALLVAVMLVRDKWRFLTDGDQTVARVTGREMHTEPGRGGPQTVYELLYTFQDPSQTTHAGRDRVPADAWVRAKSGDLVAIQYVTADPAANRIARSELLSVLGAVIAAPVGAILVALGIFLVAKQLHRTKRRLPLPDHPERAG